MTQMLKPIESPMVLDVEPCVVVSQVPAAAPVAVLA
jgi:hypothetical protein